jgi:hypothetical protein
MTNARPQMSAMSVRAVRAVRAITCVMQVPARSITYIILYKQLWRY